MGLIKVKKQVDFKINLMWFKASLDHVFFSSVPYRVCKQFNTKLFGCSRQLLIKVCWLIWATTVRKKLLTEKKRKQDWALSVKIQLIYYLSPCQFRKTQVQKLCFLTPWIVSHWMLFWVWKKFCSKKKTLCLKNILSPK